MNKITLITFLIVFSTSAFCQENLKKIRIKNKRAKTTETYFLKNDSIKEGSYIFKYKNRVQALGQYQDNLKEGIWVYTPDKDIKIIGNYQHGIKNGKWTYFSKTDTLSILNYVNGKKVGLQLGFFKNNIISREIKYNSDGIIDGEEKIFYESGKLKYINSYKNGELYGDNKLYSEEGDLLYNLSFVEDTPITLNVPTNQQSHIGYSGNLSNGSGVLNIIDNSSGKIMLTRNFKDSLLSGEILRYNSDGKLILKGMYENGYMTGEWQFYTENGEVVREINYNRVQELEEDSNEFLTQISEHHFFFNTEMPLFDGEISNSAFRYFITKTLKYPDEAASTGTEGKVLITFEINEIGQVERSRINRKVYPILDSEALRVVNLSPYWRPGFQSGIPIKVSFTFPIIFIL